MSYKKKVVLNKTVGHSKRSQFRQLKRETELDILEINDIPIGSGNPDKPLCYELPNVSVNSACDNTEELSGSPHPGFYASSIDSPSDISNLSEGGSNRTGKGSPHLNVPFDKSDSWSLCGFKKKLTHWAIEEKVSLTSLSTLLQILKEHPDFAELPRDGRTLLQTPRVTEIQNICGGSYVYIGILNGLISVLSNESILPKSLKLLIGVDGLPISHSSNSQLWPQLGKIQSLPNSSIFVIGIFHGSQKPSSANIFMNNLVTELNLLMENGFKCKDQIIQIEHVAFVCDAPAKAFLLNIKGHTGFFSCTRCEVEGSYVKGRVCFPEKNCLLRTHEKFIQQTQEDHHLQGTSVLTEIVGLDIIRDIPLDYMHLVCLGAVKKLLSLWMKGDLSYRIPSKAVQDFSKILVSFKKHIPSEFARKPRGLDEFGRWKATELRQFLLYTGPVLLKLQTHLPHDIVKHFLNLSVAMSILLNPKVCYDLQTLARSLLNDFVDGFKKLYGKHLISHNIHGLLHIADDVTTFGALDNASAFQFENHMQYLKKLLRKHHHPLQQIHRRLVESSEFLCQQKNNSSSVLVFENLHESGPLCENCCDPQYKTLKKSNFKLCCKLKDSFCSLVDGTIIRVANIAFSTLIEEMVVIGKPFEKKGYVFDKPLKSSKLNIFLIKKKKVSLKVFPVNQVFQKLVVLPYKYNLYVAIPLIHTDC